MNIQTYIVDFANGSLEEKENIFIQLLIDKFGKEEVGLICRQFNDYIAQQKINKANFPSEEDIFPKQD